MRMTGNRKATLLVIALIGSLVSSVPVQSSDASCVQEPQPQLVANPFFDCLTSGLPDHWQPMGAARIARGLQSYDALWSGPNPIAKIFGRREGDGIVQRDIKVKPNARYDFYAWVKLPEATERHNYRYFVRSQMDGTVYLSGLALEADDPSRWENVVGTGWENIVGTFLTSGNEIALIIEFLYVGQASNVPITLHLDNVTLWERAVDASPSLVQKPAKPVVLYGFGEFLAYLGDSETIAITNVYDNIFPTPAFVNGLRPRGKVVAHRVYAPDVGIIRVNTVDELVAYWLQPLRNTLQGRIAQGFDAIAIDEFLDWPDGTPASDIVAEALRKTRSLYPNRQIYVWGSWQLANGGPACWYCLPGEPTYDTILSAINRYADAFLLEAYAHEMNPQLDNPRLMAANLAQRQSVNPEIKGLLKKTVFGLAIYQASDPYQFGSTADNTPTMDFKSFLDEQFHRVANMGALYPLHGVALFAYYFTPRDTMRWTNNLVDHYVWRENSTYLGDGRLGSLLANANPSFEKVGENWEVAGNVKYLPYENLPQIPAEHGSSWSPVPHGQYLLQMVKTAAETNVAKQKVKVKPATTYAISAYVIAGKAGSLSHLRVIDAQEGRSLDKALELANLFTYQWMQTGFLFTTPERVEEIIIMLSDGGAREANVIYWDYVELTEKSSLDTFGPIISATPTSLTTFWITDLPSTGRVEYASTLTHGNLSLLDPNLSTDHKVTLTGLDQGRQYHLRHTNIVPAKSPLDPENASTSFNYSPFTLMAE